MSYDEVNHIQNVFRTFPVRLSIPTHELGDVKPSQRRTKKLSPITASVSLCIGHDFLLRGSAAPCSDELDVLDVLPPRGELAEIGCQISVEGQSLNSREVEAVSNLIRQDTAWLGVLGVDWNAEKEDVLSHPPVGQNCDIESAACEGMRKDLTTIAEFPPIPTTLRNCLETPHPRHPTEISKRDQALQDANVVLPDATVVPNASPSFDTVTFALPTSWRQSQVNASTEVGSSYMVEASDYIKKDDDWEDLAFLMDSASDEDDLAFLVDSASDEDDLDFLVDSDDDDLASLMNSALSI
ncbi:hypothetical protein M427DRAFT_28727 [Gonapodya prolifera JEL478]|uniref:Uncharacterized protein n=1 Tax=Gonapodya prolifera (strain JEL478) TaxID=1344416 RepID=A0A139ASY5_GONPJ|nr:hypothetical protein M427DRAFT_28727 [Gonapodya prolifera JEL478]|eukprot:KXS19829.1 hypothetical protein M427DRAFT_28727 [Gonapodya prolifera JEL478]